MKKLLSVLLALSILSAAAGCGDTTSVESPAPSELPAVSQPVESLPPETSAPETSPTPQPPVSEIESLSISVEQEWESEWSQDWGIPDPLCQVKYPSFSLSDRDEERYPALEEALEKWDEKLEAWGEHFFDHYAPIAQATYTEGTFLTGWRGEASLLLRRADSQMVSLLFPLSVSENDGSGADWFMAANLDSETGKEIPLYEVIFGFDKLPGLLEAQLKEQYPEVEFYPVADILQDYLEADPKGGSFVWTLEPHGITFHFGSGELSPNGTHSATLLYSAHPDLFLEPYAAPMDSYILSFPMDTPFFADLNDDGRLDSIQIWGVWDEYGTSLETVVSINGIEVASESYCFAMAPYLVHLEDGRDYLYVDLSRENDYHSMLVFDLNGDAPVFADEFWNMGFLTYEWGDAPAELPTDPAKLLMVSRVEALSTYSGWQFWSVGEDGAPVPNGGYYNAIADLTLTSKVELTAQVLSEEIIPSGETRVLPVGTELTILRSDNDSFVDFRLKDGSQVRLEVQLHDWPDRVNGIAVEDCFDGTIYAG